MSATLDPVETEADPRLVKESFALIEPVSGEVVAYFYGRLFAENPRLRAMFPPTMDVQRERLFGALARIAWSMDSPEALQAYLGQLGRDHRKFGVAAEHYGQFGRALIATIRKFTGDAWTAETERAWTTAYDQAAQTMINAAAEDAGEAPPWWLAEVLGHDRRTPDIAVLTVRPDKPFRYQAGQHMSVQSARTPRDWRTFCIANAPREDGLLEFHVRAVPAGRVSNALVRYTSVGDTLLLGPAKGTMVADTGPGPGILCVADGTGLAPVKAIIQQVASQQLASQQVPGESPGQPAGEPRSIHLFFGAQREAGLYDLEDLRVLESAYPSLRVIPAVSGEPGFCGARGTLPDVVRRYGSWSDHDVYLSGPAGTVRDVTEALTGLGTPMNRIHYEITVPEG
jgi:NAD(P)H-flavin reductase/hemoglobin-like flavoprotein